MELDPCQDLLDSRAPSRCLLKDMAQEDHGKKKKKKITRDGCHLMGSFFPFSEIT